MCFLQREDEALDSHRKLSHYFGVSAFCRGGDSDLLRRHYDLRWATDNDALFSSPVERNYSGVFMPPARYRCSGYSCRCAFARYRNIYMTLSHGDVKVIKIEKLKLHEAQLQSDES